MGLIISTLEETSNEDGDATPRFRSEPALDFVKPSFTAGRLEKTSEPRTEWTN